MPIFVPMLKFRDAGHFNKTEEKLKESQTENENFEIFRLKNRINLNETDNLSYFTKIYEFLKAPIVKFAYDKVKSYNYAEILSIFINNFKNLDFIFGFFDFVQFCFIV